MSKIPDAKLLIVGTEQLKNNLKNMANELEVSKIIEFKGFVKAYRGVEKILVKHALGLATYKPNPNSITQHMDPSKPQIICDSRITSDY